MTNIERRPIIEGILDGMGQVMPQHKEAIYNISNEGYLLPISPDEQDEFIMIKLKNLLEKQTDRLTENLQILEKIDSFLVADRQQKLETLLELETKLNSIIK